MRRYIIILQIVLLSLLVACDSTQQTTCPGENKLISGVCFDITKPTFFGVDDIRVTQGQSIDLLAGVNAIDDMDGNLNDSIQVKGNVNFFEPGTYVIEYYVEDNSNNPNIAIRYITVLAANAVDETDDAIDD